MRRRLYALLLIFALLFPAISAQAVTPSDWSADNMGDLEPGHLYSQTAVVIDASTGDVLFDKDSRVRMYPASTTKIMTLLLALESDIPMDQTVTIPAEAANIPSDGSTVPVYPGEEMSFQDLLYGFMLKSGNDGANAIAVLVGGSISEFVRSMNERAKEMGCTSTNFTNAHGLHDELHYSTAMDLALMTQCAMKNETFREIVACSSYTMAPTVNRESLEIQSRVLMVNPGSQVYYEDCIGVKTGFTSKAGNCFVGAAERDGVTLICVAMHSSADNANQKWVDAARMFEYGFLQYDRYTLEAFFDGAGTDFTSISIDNAAKDDPQKGLLTLRLSQVSDSDFGLLIKKSDQAYKQAVADFVNRSTCSVAEDLAAPIEDGQIIGTLSYQAPDGREITGMLTATRAVAARPEQVTIYDVFPFLTPLQPFLSSGWALYGLIVLLIVVVLLIVRRIRRKIRRNRRRQEIYDIKRRQYQREQELARREAERRRQEEIRRRREAQRRAAEVRRAREQRQRSAAQRPKSTPYRRPDPRKKPPMGGRR